MTVGIDQRLHTARSTARPPGRKFRVRRGLYALAVLLGLGAVWVAVTAVLARAELERARTDANALRTQLTAGRIDAAAATAGSAADHGRRAHRYTAGPAWATMAHLPVVGAPFHSFRGLTGVADTLGRGALPELVAASHDLDPALLRSPDGRIDVARIAAAAPGLARADRSVAAAFASATSLPAHSWLPMVDAARADVLAQLDPLAQTTHVVSQAAALVPPMLGADGPRTYFVAFQNDAEARGTGGLPGAFAIVTADHGAIRFDRFGADAELVGASATVDLGADYAHLYQNAGTNTIYGSGNLSPNFPYAAAIWASMWAQHSGQKVDGVLAVDPGALGYLLGATGPATLPDGTRLNAANVVALTQSESYARFRRDEPGRQRFLIDVAKAVSEKVISGQGSPSELLGALDKAAAERRLLAWSADPRVQDQLAATPIAGVVPQTSAPYAGMSVVNEGGNKLDYYLDRSLDWRAEDCGRTRNVTVTMTLTNNAPKKGLPPTVTARSDPRAKYAKPGDNRLSLAYAATEGAQMSAVTVDGRASTAGVGSERGHPVFTVDVELPAGATRTIVLHLQEPSSDTAPVVLRQPLVRPLRVAVHDAPCGRTQSSDGR